LLAGFTCGWFLNKPGLQVFTIIPDADEPWKRATVLAAVVLGGGLIVIDSLLADLPRSRDAPRPAAVVAASITDSGSRCIRTRRALTRPPAHATVGARI
jgi:hypothetical protein